MILGITGPAGAGKGAVVAYMCSTQGFEHLSVRAFLIEEIEKRNMPITRDSMILVANELRTAHGAGYIMEQLYTKASAAGKNCIIESIRAIGEVETLKKHSNFVLLSVDAAIHVRYERVVKRGDTTDNITFEKFAEQESREMQNDEPFKQNIAGCMKLADITIRNEGTFDELHTQIEQTLGNMVQ